MSDKLNAKIAKIIVGAKYLDLRDLSASLVAFVNEAASPTADFMGFSEGALADPLFNWAEFILTEEQGDDR